jgi:probable lipoprotein (TIGR04455 family)
MATAGAEACGSAIDTAYLLRGYDVKATGAVSAVKRIAVAGWAPSEYTDLAPLAAQVATDFVKLRKNYVVFDPVVIKRDFGEACGSVEGVLEVRVLDVEVDGEEVTARLQTDLYRCADGALLWRSAGELEAESDDQDLRQLAAAYTAKAGAAAKQFAAPLFAVLQDLLAPLPDPVLNDEEIAEKIERG